MKLLIPAAAAFVALLSLSSPAAFAADDKPAEAAATPDTKQVQPKKKVKPHSHVEEKTGVPQTAPEPQADKPDPATDKTKHYHPRDAK